MTSLSTTQHGKLATWLWIPAIGGLEKKALLPRGLVVDVSWPDGTVTVDVSRDEVRNAP